MSHFGDYENEMSRPGPDDETIDRLLAGKTVVGFEAVAAFVEEAQRLPAPVPQPTAALALAFRQGISDNAVTAPVAAPTHRSPRKPRTMIETVLAKLAAAGLVAKAGLAAGALTLTASAAAATGNLPVAQDQVADAADRVGIEIPGGKSEAARDAIANTEPGPERGKAVSEAVKSDRAGAGADNAEAGKAKADAARANADAGRAKADAARANAPAGAGSTSAPVATPNAGGTSTAGTASSGASDSGTDTAGEQAPAADAGADNAEERRPEGAPSADDNPGSGRRP